MKKKRVPSEKQLEALARARAKLAEKRGQVAQASTSELPKAKRVGGRKWWPIYAGIGLLIIAVLIAKLYLDSNNNMILAVLFVMFGASGGFSIFHGLKRRDEGYTFVKHGEEKVNINANCLNIYYKKDESGAVKCDYIAFEEMIPPDKYEELKRKGEILPGQVKGDILSRMPQRCLDDGKFYYVHIFDPAKNEYTSFELPDTQYFDPREMVNPIIMPSVKKEMKPIPTLGEKLRPALLVIGIAILTVLFIATGEPPPAGG